MTHQEMVVKACKWLTNTRRCLWVLAGRSAGYYFGEQIDAFGWDTHGESHLIECKVSRSDFYADRKKPHRMYPGRGMGHYRWYMVPDELKKIQVPDHWGLVYIKNGRAFIRQKATGQPCNRQAEICMLIRRLLQEPESEKRFKKFQETGIAPEIKHYDIG
nr:hypothetical protein 2 [Candidatus Omnitrophota bacterium]